MGSPITLQNLTDAGTDCATLAAVVNGPASGSGSTVATRTGPTVKSLANALANMSGFVPTGAYNAGTTYTQGQVVNVSGSSYVSIVNANTGNAPATSPTYWTLIASVGAPGSVAASGLYALAAAMIPGFAGRNLFDYTQAVTNQFVQPDGSLSATTIGWGSSGLIYCPGATSMITNIPALVIGGSGLGNFCTYDENGTFIAVLPESNFSTSRDIPNGVACPLPGTQTYVRFSWVIADLGDSSYTTISTIDQGMFCVSVGGTAVLPGSFEAAGLATQASVGAAFASFISSFAGALDATLKVVLPSPPTTGINLYDNTKTASNLKVNPDGTVTTGAWETVTIYCPGATGFITDIPIRGVPNGLGFCLYDAFGNFIEDLSTTELASDWTMGNCLVAGAVYALPGTQTYIKFSFVPSNYAGYSFANSDNAAVFMCGDATTACPTAIPYGGSPSFSKPVTTVKYASQLGAPLDSNLATGGGSDCTALLNAFLATASAANPIKLILDGPCLVTGLVIADAGYTTIEGLGRGCGIYLANGAYQDGVRIGAYTAGTGSSEGFGITVIPAQTATKIALRNFTINMNASNNPSPTAANVPVAGAAAHSIFATVLANCTDVVVENMNYVHPPCYNLVFANTSNVRVAGCEFSSTGYGQDGIHIDGPCSDIVISDCAFATGDDAIALNAPEGYGGDISRVTVTNCRFNNSLTVMRIYTSANPGTGYTVPGATYKVRNIAVSNCVGTVSTMCFNLGISGGSTSTATADQIHDFTVSNCAFAGTLGLGLLLAPAGSLVFRGITYIPTSASSLFYVEFGGVGNLLLDDVRVLRNADGSSPLDSFIDVFSGIAMDRVTLLNCRAIDEEGSAYTAHTSLIKCVGTISTLRLSEVDLTNIAALFSSDGTAGVTALVGEGVIGTGAQVPDSVMGNNSMYLSSNDSGAPSIKVGGTAKRFTLA